MPTPTAKHKFAALFGTVLMGIGCGVACLANTPTVSHFGSALLLLSIVIMTYGFYYWRP